jgi:hypothetical protein
VILTSESRLEDRGGQQKACPPPTRFDSISIKFLSDDLKSQHLGKECVLLSLLTGMATAREVASRAHTRFTRHRQPNAA